MNNRGWIGSLLWVVAFNFCVAWVAFDLGIGWAITLLCLRHVLIGIPNFYNNWRKLIVGNQTSKTLPNLQIQVWPNRKWITETVVCSLISFVLLFWFNYPLKNLLF